jgi:hypothetical protein
MGPSRTSLVVIPSIFKNNARNWMTIFRSCGDISFFKCIDSRSRNALKPSKRLMTVS